MYSNFLIPLIQKIFERKISENRKKKRYPHFLLKKEMSGSPRIWFHAASVGEFEGMVPLIESLKEVNVDLIVTIFSESAEKTLSQSMKDWPHVKWGGYAPFEGEWKNSLEKIKPDLFVTVKYEAWPDLWNALFEYGIPLWILGAQWRPSLKWVKRILGKKIPDLHFFSFDEKQLNLLKKFFSKATGQVVFDPRWDRIAQRNEVGNPRARSILESLKDLPRPWGVLGSVWESDIPLLYPSIQREKQLRGTLFWVPHDVSHSSIQSWKNIFQKKKWNFIDSTHLLEGTLPRWSESRLHHVFIPEMGFLLELYAQADWAYVGGGFESGIHSTMEPAIHGIPVSGGPCRAESFSEITHLIELGQMRVVRNADDFHEWITSLQLLSEKKKLSNFLGGTKQIFTVFVDFLQSKKIKTK